MSAYHVYRFAEFLVRWLPEPIARRLSFAVGRLSSALQRRNRAILLKNLTIVFGQEKSPAELRELRRRIYGNFGRFVYEFVHLPRITQENVHDILTPESLETARRLGEMAQEQPVVAITAHIGHWELGAAAVGLAGYPIAVIVDFHPNPKVTQYFDGVRRSRGVNPIPLSSFHRLFRALKRGALVAIVADRAVTGQGIAMKYFGQDFLAPDGYAALARRFGAKIVPTFCIRREHGLYEFTIGEPIEIEPTDDAEADIRDCVARVLSVLETKVRDHPDQWYAFRPIWGVGRTDRMNARRSRELHWRRRSNEVARQAVEESHELRRTARENRGRNRR